MVLRNFILCHNLNRNTCYTAQMDKHKSLKTGSTKHRVHLDESTNGTGEKLFAYSYKTLAEMFDVREGTIRQWVNRNKFDPTDLTSIFSLHKEREHMAPWEKEEGWTNLGAHKGEGIGGLEAKYDGSVYVDIRSTDNREVRLFISKPALKRAIELFDEGDLRLGDHKSTEALLLQTLGEAYKREKLLRAAYVKAERGRLTAMFGREAAEAADIEDPGEQVRLDAWCARRLAGIDKSKG